MGSETLNDDQLIEFAASFRKGILGRRRKSAMMCFAICAPLASLLSMYGVNAEIVEGEIDLGEGSTLNHFWLRLTDGRVLDPTADQFGDLFDLPPVYLGEPLQIHRPKP